MCRALPQSIPPHWTNSQRKAMLRTIEAIYAPRSVFRLICKQWREAHDHRVVSIGRLLWKVPSARPRPGLFSNVTSVDMSGTRKRALKCQCLACPSGTCAQRPIPDPPYAGTLKPTCDAQLKRVCKTWPQLQVDVHHSLMRAGLSSAQRPVTVLSLAIGFTGAGVEPFQIPRHALDSHQRGV